MKVELEVLARIPLKNKVSQMNNAAINKLTTFGRFRKSGQENKMCSDDIFMVSLFMDLQHYLLDLQVGDF